MRALSGLLTGRSSASSITVMSSSSSSLALTSSSFSLAAIWLFFLPFGIEDVAGGVEDSPAGREDSDVAGVAVGGVVLISVEIAAVDAVTMLAAKFAIDDDKLGVVFGDVSLDESGVESNEDGEIATGGVDMAPTVAVGAVSVTDGVAMASADVRGVVLDAARSIVASDVGGVGAAASVVSESAV